jgi:hypothetical protein
MSRTAGHEILEKTLTRLGTDIEKLHDSTGWQSMLRSAAHFHNYSMHNRILIWVQNREATRVNGFVKWQKLNRQVRKGEKGLKILAPIMVKQIDPESFTEELVLVGYKVVTVFDIAQTDVMEGKEDGVVELEWPMSPNPAELYWELAATIQFRTGLGITHHDEMAVIVGGHQARGWYDRQARAITVTVPPESGAGVLLHELGHHFDPLAVEDPVLYHGDTKASGKELVAQSAAWLVAQKLGLDLTEETVFYDCNWEGGVQRLIELSSRISKTERAMWEVVKELVSTEETKVA